jgi:hypothetical protein
MYFSMIRLRRDISPRDMAAMTKGDGYQIASGISSIAMSRPTAGRVSTPSHVANPRTFRECGR